MIKINLLGEKVDNTLNYLVQVAGYGVIMFLVIGGSIFTQVSLSGKMAEAEQQKSTLSAELVLLQKTTKKVEGLEENKRKLHEKLQTIAILKARKHGPVHVIEDLNLAVPDRAWLLEVKEASGFLELSGIALDDTTVADFMRKLEESEYFSVVDLVHSTQHLVDDVKMKEFVMKVALAGPMGQQTAVKQGDADAKEV